ncbi:MAG: arginine repressor [Candidatus Limivicinus sp.]|nr:arginine repressor [Clostridiales bacterium]MDY3859719.1 arginine repressor [Candidatus Limivicinus sp.]
MKLGRQSVIMEIINERDIETQNQLLEALAERGVKSTQATLSRDIRDMRLVKEMGPNGSYRYVAATKQDNSALDVRLRKIFKEGVLSYDIAQNLLVIKTLPGLAPAACSALDSMEIDGLVGTLAGDDTAFIAMRDNVAAQSFYHEIEELI